jgi:hypothetical protein
MAHLDFKVTCWKRFAVPDDKVEEVIKRLKESDCDEVYDIQDIEGVYFVNDGPDAECEEPMIPSENGGSATQELYNSEGDVIYHNSENENEY